MAQEIMVMGAIYEDVPSVRLPDSNGTFHPFTDTSDTTAVAGDVAQGKTFHLADGTLATGTASGGGGGAIKMGVLRPDAELWQRFTCDRWAVADDGVEIPAYTTSSKTLKAQKTIATITDLDTDEYSYYVLCRGLTIPKYVSGTAAGAAEPIYHAFSNNYELNVTDAQAIAPSGIQYGAGAYVTTFTGSAAICVYRLSATACKASFGFNSSYGCYQTGGAPSLSGTRFVINSPTLGIRGETSIFKQAYWDALEDIRYQYAVEVYRAPNGGEYFDGFNVQSHLAHTLSCATSASGNLT